MPPQIASLMPFNLQMHNIYMKFFLQKVVQDRQDIYRQLFLQMHFVLSQKDFFDFVIDKA